MIPQGGTLQLDSQILETLEQPSLTYELNLKEKTIAGYIDGLEAVKQAVVKILQTRRFEHLIYSSNYGQELQSSGGTRYGPMLKLSGTSKKHCCRMTAFYR